MTFWSVYVIALTAITLIASTWLLWITSKKRNSGDTQSSTETTGHVWDGDLTEYNKPLPRWWINLFYLTIVFAIGYLIWYPSADKVDGRGGWSSKSQHDADKAKADAKLQAMFARFDGQSIDAIARDPQALATGRQIFSNNCAVCHGSDAGGAVGFPKLNDGVWQWGGDPATLLATIREGRKAAMPALGAALGSEQAVTETAVYVQSLSGLPVDDSLAAAGAKHFANVCAACHGADGRGNPALGAPNLTDNDWLYGSSLDVIKYGINNGRQGQMPAFETQIGETQSRLVAAYVYSLSQADPK